MFHRDLSGDWIGPECRDLASVAEGPVASLAMHGNRAVGIIVPDVMELHADHRPVFDRTLITLLDGLGPCAHEESVRQEALL